MIVFKKGGGGRGEKNRVWEFPFLPPHIHTDAPLEQELPSARSARKKQ